MEERILDYADKLEAAITQYGPGVWQQTLMVVRVDGLAAIVGGFVALVVAVLLAPSSSRGTIGRLRKRRGVRLIFSTLIPSSCVLLDSVE